MALNPMKNSLKINRAVQKLFQHAIASASCVDSQTRREIVTTEQVSTGNYIPRVFYGGRYTVTLLPGAGIGPELMGYVKDIFKFTGVPVDFEEVNISSESEHCLEDLKYAITSIRRNGIALKGNIDMNNDGLRDCDAMSGNVALRKELDLYVNAVHCVSYPGVPARHTNLDVAIIRQNVEGEYSMLEHEAVDGVVESMKVMTKDNVERIARYAFDFAVANNRKKVTIVHKANIMKLSDGLFLSVARAVAKEYPSIVQTDMIVDNACMQLVSNPHQFDMILTTNLYGSIISNVLCGLLGGAGLYSGRNVGYYQVVFEPATRNTGTRLAGRNAANPLAMINASVDMLDYLGLVKYAAIIRAGIVGALREGICTRDFGGVATSTEVVDCIKKHIDLNDQLEKLATVG